MECRFGDRLRIQVIIYPGLRLLRHSISFSIDTCDVGSVGPHGKTHVLRLLSKKPSTCQRAQCNSHDNGHASKGVREWFTVGG